ncbi:MAG: hypothetical protein EPN79_11980 [Burkholderiaceae bacterium]|nr:MAG: hypothetical protein EPN79_11980 [Burkholderiaceae bacterium]TBR76857.1 MAG: hypothetical protein EPN64_06450 [Burkholderiaceae bacterium]
MIDHNVAAAARMYNEPAIAPMEDEVLGALEAHDATHAAWEETQRDLRKLFEKVLSAWLYPGAELNNFDRDRPPCLLPIRIVAGNAHNALKFRVAEDPYVVVDDRGDPVMSKWSVRAIPLSNKTGKEISGNTVNGQSKDGSVTLTGTMFPQFMFRDLTGPALAQRERDEFIRMVAKAEAILVEREQVVQDTQAQPTS